mgnify:CR=1 FL=1
MDSPDDILELIQDALPSYILYGKVFVTSQKFKLLKYGIQGALMVIIIVRYLYLYTVKKEDTVKRSTLITILIAFMNLVAFVLSIRSYVKDMYKGINKECDCNKFEQYKKDLLANKLKD